MVQCLHPPPCAFFCLEHCLHIPFVDLPAPLFHPVQQLLHLFGRAHYTIGHHKTGITFVTHQHGVEVPVAYQRVKGFQVLGDGRAVSEVNFLAQSRQCRLGQERVAQEIIQQQGDAFSLPLTLLPFQEDAAALAQYLTRHNPVDLTYHPLFLNVVILYVFRGVARAKAL